MGCCRCAVRSTTPPQLVLLLVVLYASAVADAISVRASQASRQAVLRGGSGATKCDDHDDGAPDVPPTFSDFASTAVDFFDAFGEAVKQASSTCKPSSFGLSPPSAPSIQQRPDRAVFSKVYTHLRGLHADAISMISRGELTSFITAWLRLNQQLQLFLCGEDAVQVCPTLLDEDTRATLLEWRATCTRKPSGTVSTLLTKLARRHAAVVAAHAALVDAALEAAQSQRDALARHLSEALEQVEAAELRHSAASHATVDHTALAEEVQALQTQLGEAQAQLRATSEQLQHSREQSEEAVASALAQQRQALEAELAQRLEEATSARQAAEAEAQAQSAAMLAQLSAAEQQVGQLRSQLESTSAEAASAQAAAATAQQQLSALEQEHASLVPAFRAQLAGCHEQLQAQGAARAQLEQQAAARAHAMAAFDREMEAHAPHAQPVVPLGQFRALQLELSELLERHAAAQSHQVALLQQIEFKEAAAAAEAARGAAMARQAQQLHARLQALEGVRATQGESAAVQGRAEPARLGRSVDDAANHMGMPTAPSSEEADAEGALWSKLSSFKDIVKTRSSKLRDLSKGFVSDLSSSLKHGGVESGGAAEATGAA